MLRSHTSNAQIVCVTTRDETRAGRGTQSETLLVKLLFLASCHDIFSIYKGQTTVNRTYTLHRALTEQQKLPPPSPQVLLYFRVATSSPPVTSAGIPLDEITYIFQSVRTYRCSQGRPQRGSGFPKGNYNICEM